MNLYPRQLRPWSFALTAVACAAAAAGSVSWIPASAASDPGPPGWVASWGASPSPATPPSLAGPDDHSAAGFNGQTVRDIVFSSAGGSAARVTISNTFGSSPLSVGEADLAVAGQGAAVRPGTGHRLTFGGSGSVTVPPGAQVRSDPARMAVPALTDLAVSIYLPGKTGPATYHSDAQQTNYISGTGNFAGQESGAAFSTTSGSWYYADAVDVTASPPLRGTVVAFGDSITDGYQSTPSANLRWPNDLARRLLSSPGPGLGVPDEGISGNRILHDSACFGVNALSRFRRDALSQSGVRDVILLEGINDIGFSQTPDTGCTVPNTAVSADQIIAGDRQLIRDAHARGVKIFGGTLTPFKGAAYWSAAAEAKRDAVNNWLRTSHAFDGVIDFASAVASSSDPQVMNPGYDSGDHLHPNDAGYQAMANAINLSQLR